MTHIFDLLLQRYVGSVELTIEELTKARGLHALPIPEHNALFLDFQRLSSLAVQFLVSKMVAPPPDAPCLTFKQFLAKWGSGDRTRDILFSGALFEGDLEDRERPMIDDMENVLDVSFQLAQLQ